jgi:hypothetical protein
LKESGNGSESEGSAALATFSQLGTIAKALTWAHAFVLRLLGRALPRETIRAVQSTQNGAESSWLIRDGALRLSGTFYVTNVWDRPVFVIRADVAGGSTEPDIMVQGPDLEEPKPMVPLKPNEPVWLYFSISVAPEGVPTVLGEPLVLPVVLTDNLNNRHTVKKAVFRSTFSGKALSPEIRALFASPAQPRITA